MTVKELIEELNLLNCPDQEVRISYDSGFAECGIASVYINTGSDKAGHAWKSEGKVVIRTNQ